ncbi:Rieske (2Fe-2S) protein [Saccharophagus degradans]|uniref:Rieske (2Fe-2S) protein n=1 Tax=Saccharophagus degradans TaxID=86304 RepID=A0AAW7X951_9GAMM|nr:Rieske (2Fe-2S) protein [Saccharophagus degradans]MBU2986337.1 Rieske (2Fe-2S) protein [Saccharophagus degradans]MDO6424380.1 Rieske (2Fe-2S) protein [Saccharophagus degradans]MDO6608413.1 Rieske (2Fe-2S) protein [Saccharophagus degradans]WGO99194.1 Rieske (2Fe-2S) protein [Saccharophagus degradans]
MHPICKVNALSNGESLSFTLNDTPCFITKHDDQFFAYQNACPHLGVTMEWQPNSFLDSDKELIQCSMHGALFLIDSGECVYGPCQGKALTPIKISQQGDTVFAE